MNGSWQDKVAIEGRVGAQSVSSYRSIVKRLGIRLAWMAVLMVSSVQAAPTHCAQHYWSSTAPNIVNAKLGAQTREVCFRAFGVMHSGITRTPLWSAEYLTRDRLDAARGLSRVNNFHAESGLPSQERAELKDYVRSGYDRGHMSPSADMPDARAQQESFSLSNMVPQNPEHNRYLWAGIESSVRALAQQRGALYVITGPLFKGAQLTHLNGRVMVPSQLYKIVYDPKRQQASVYLAANEATGEYTVVTVATLEQLAGIDFFPDMPPRVKTMLWHLPAPKMLEAGRQKRDAQMPTYREIDTVLNFLRTILK